MYDRQREEIVHYLAAHSAAVLSMQSSAGTYALPIRYHSQGLQITCRLPRWSDAAYYARQRLAVVLIVPDTQDGTCWLHYIGEATAASETNTSALAAGELHDFHWERYCTAILVPRRINLIDQRRGWGWRQTIEC